MWLLDDLERLKDSDSIAVVYREETISYRELWRRSEAIGAYLEKQGLNKKPLVIYGNKETDIICCMHAALKVGVPYVPVDTLYPKERLLKIAYAVEADLVINFSDIELDEFDTVRQSDLNDIYDCNVYWGGTDKEHWVREEDICYILFTSGSTGEPKGVPISKGNLVNFSTWFSKYVALSEDGNGVLNQAPYSFDLSVIGLFVCLPMGKYLLSIDKQMSANFKDLLGCFKKYKPEIWVSTPSFMDMCTYEGAFFDAVDSLKLIMFDGEIFSKRLASKLFLGLKSVRIVNAYGPTEATVAISACEILPEMIEDELELPIGTVLDDGEIQIESGYENDYGYDVGELLISSRSVAQGYYKNPVQTGKVFFDGKRGNRGYRTGDLVFQKNGLLYYIGRQDFQIKLNGYRIELSDIEANLNKLQYVAGCVVLPVKREDKIEYLIACVLPGDGLPDSALKAAITIKRGLTELVPVYMVPKKIALLKEFPLNTNGKIDRKKLMEEYCRDN